jgi:hypothetical protein
MHPFLDDGSAAHLHYTPGSCSQGGIMRHEHKRGARLAIEPEKHLYNRPAGLGVEVACRLVGEENLRPMNECAREGNALLLATGELQWIVVEAVGEADVTEDSRGVLPAAVFAAEFQRHEYILDGGERGNELEILEDESDGAIAQGCARIFIERAEFLAIEADCPRGRVIESGAEPKERGLSAPGRANDRTRVAGLKAEMNVAQDGQLVAGSAIDLR